jgi:hypothetical protein
MSDQRDDSETPSQQGLPIGREELQNLITEAMEKPRKNGKPDPLELVLKWCDEGGNVELFLDKTSRDAFASIRVKGVLHTLALTSSSFAGALRMAFQSGGHGIIKSSVLKEAVEQLGAKAEFGGVERDVALRIGGDGEAVFIDLANGKGDVIEITSEGSQITSDAPVKFWRADGMQALPIPEPNEDSLESLIGPLVNTKSREDLVLLIAAFIGGFSPTGPYPVFVINGQQGSAKSSLCAMLSHFLDPKAAPLGGTPRNTDDFIVTALQNWLVILDNVSSISPELSDNLAKVATGTAMKKRKQYANKELVIDVITC